jgi:hypothetical protein
MTVSTYADPAGVHNPSPGGVAPATWFTQLNTNFLAIRNKPSAKIRASASQSLTSSSTTQVTMGTVVFDNSTLMTGTANSLTIPTNYGGVWLVSAQVRVDSTPSNAHNLLIQIGKNLAGTAYYEFVQRGTAAGSASTFSGTFLMQLAATDTIQIYITTSTNISAISTGISAQSALGAVWLSA